MKGEAQERSVKGKRRKKEKIKETKPIAVVEIEDREKSN